MYHEKCTKEEIHRQNYNSKHQTNADKSDIKDSLHQMISCFMFNVAFYDFYAVCGEQEEILIKMQFLFC